MTLWGYNHALVFLNNYNNNNIRSSTDILSLLMTSLVSAESVVGTNARFNLYFLPFLHSYRETSDHYYYYYY